MQVWSSVRSGTRAVGLLSCVLTLAQNEIGLIFTDIIIFILENPTSTILQRWLVIQVLERIFKSPQTLVDIFLNYDSDLKGANIFEKLVNDISAIAKASFPLENSPAPTQEVRICVCDQVCCVHRTALS